MKPIAADVPAANWLGSAACRGEDPTWWDTPQARAGRVGPDQVAAARKGLALCKTCPVAADCHLDALRSKQAGVIRAGIPYDDAGYAAKKCKYKPCRAVIIGRNGNGADYCTNRCQNRASQERVLAGGLRGTGEPRGVGASLDLLPLLSPDVVARFHRRVQRGGPGECWLWTGELSHRGAGRMPIYPGDGKLRVTVHRVAWTLAHRREVGPYPVKQVCGNRRCCNPRHLKRPIDPTPAMVRVAA